MSSHTVPLHPDRHPNSQTPLNRLQPLQLEGHVWPQLMPYRPCGHSKPTQDYIKQYINFLYKDQCKT